MILQFLQLPIDDQKAFTGDIEDESILSVVNPIVPRLHTTG